MTARNVCSGADICGFGINTRVQSPPLPTLLKLLEVREAAVAPSPNRVTVVDGPVRHAALREPAGA